MGTIASSYFHGIFRLAFCRICLDFLGSLVILERNGYHELPSNLFIFFTRIYDMDFDHTCLAYKRRGSGVNFDDNFENHVGNSSLLNVLQEADKFTHRN